MKSVKLKIDNSRIMDSIEYAHLKITSPSGKSITLYKHRLNLCDEHMQNVFWKFCNDPYVRFIGEMDATIDEMKILLELSKILK